VQKNQHGTGTPSVSAVTVDDQVSLMRFRAGLSEASRQLKHGKAATWALTFMTFLSEASKGRDIWGTGLQ